MKFIEIVTGYPKASSLLPKEDFFRYPCMIAKELGLEPEIWCVREKGMKKEERMNSIFVRRFSNAFSLYLHLWGKDIALVHASLRPHLPSLLAGLTPKRKIFTTLTYELGSNALVRAVSLFLISRFDKVLTLTPYEQEIYRKEGIDSDLIPLAIDYGFFSRPVRAARKKYGLEEGFTLITVANFRAFKNLDVMVESFDRFSRQKDARDAQFIVVGQDMLQNKGYREQKGTSATVQAIIEKNKNIRWLGHRSPSEIRELLALADVYVSSSSVEAQGLTNYEAAAAGKAMCLSRIGSFTTVFGKDALYHPSHDADALAENLLRYYKDLKLRRRNGEAVQERMKAWEYAKIKKKLIRAYSEVLHHV